MTGLGVSVLYVFNLIIGQCKVIKERLTSFILLSSLPLISCLDIVADA